MAKFRLTLKDPDGVYESLQEAAKDSIAGVATLSASEREALIDLRRESLSGAMARWVEFGEYVTIEIDTDARTAVVVEAGREADAR
jgi:hypothetical protein